MTGKWPTLVLLSIATLLGMSVWFSASAVVPQLTLLWQLDDSGRAWLTMSVQIGFVVGALGSSLLNLADRLPARWMTSISSVLAALATASIAAFASSLGPALVLRFLTGVALAGVYPVAMKTMATWTKADRGLGIGLLVGALTLGSGMPHLINASGGIGGGGVGRRRRPNLSHLCARRTLRDACPEVQLAPRRSNPPRPRDHARQHWISGSHVGTVCDVGLAAGVFIGKFRYLGPGS